MCGILGIIGKEDIISPMIEGLKKLAYRGYDSSGLATINDQTIIKEGTKIGPFSRLRNNVILGKKVKIGNFVEVKN